MPKIKFSTLVSGVSGKSNGSVFGTNNAGSYFRTNGSKIKPNTASNSRRKSLFSQVAGSWRNLTEEEQTAWNNAVRNFVVKNSFGDNRTPSGYEVYSRINNALLERGSEMVSMPPSPRSMPSIADLETVSPDFFLYMPSNGLLNYNKLTGSGFNSWISSDIGGFANILSDQFISFQFGIPKVEQNKQTLLTSIGILNIPGSTGDDLFVELYGLADGLWKIKLSTSGGVGIREVTTVSPVVDLSILNTLGILFASGSAAEIEMYLNGELLETTPYTSGTYGPNTFDGIIEVLPQFDTINMGGYWMDFRVYTIPLTTEQKQNVTLGYVLGTESAIFNTEDVTSDKKVMNWKDVDDGSFRLVSAHTLESVEFNISNTRVPKIDLVSESEGSAGIAVQIYSTGCMSYGKTGKISNYKLIGEVPYTSAASFSVSDLWLRIFKLYTPNGNMYFYLKVIDTTTGVINSTQIKPKKPKRFKAGAELSASVN